jgi:hypothetical protein
MTQFLKEQPWEQSFKIVLKSKLDMLAWREEENKSFIMLRIKFLSLFLSRFYNLMHRETLTE